MNNNLDTSGELVVLLDNNGKQIGTQTKKQVHHANTPLHLAFSCYVFNQKGQLLLTKRASVKKVWPDVWTNSFCGHPLPNESFKKAIKRRAKHELGIDNLQNITKIMDYSYKTPLYKGVIENEICPVYCAIIDEKSLQLHPYEVDDYVWVDEQEYLKFINSKELLIAYWLKDQRQKMLDANIDLFALTV